MEKLNEFTEKNYEHVDKYNINDYLTCYKVPDDIINRYITVLSIDKLCYYQDISEEIANNYYNILNWNIIKESILKKRTNTSENIIKKYGFLIRKYYK